MTASGWNPWKLTAIGMAVVAVTAVVTGLVVAHLTGPRSEQTAAVQASPPAVPPPPPAPAAPVSPQAPRVPTQAVVQACNEAAAAQGGRRDRTAEVVKDAVVGAVAGAAIGAAGGAIADGGKGAGKGAAIGGIVGAGAGSLYGLNENRKHDQAYRDAYAACLRARGYAA